MISRKSHFSRIALLIAWSALVPGTALAALPQVLNHQGRIAVQGVNFDGNGQFKFALVNADGSVTYWSNNGSSVAGFEPTAAVTLAVSRGLYSVLLGNLALPNMTGIPSSALEHDDVRLRVWFNDGAKGFQQISPDQPLAAVPYAIHAREALAADTFGGLLAGDVTGGQSATAIADATVTGKRLTGFASTTGLVSADDSLLSAIGKLHGNGALLAPLASPTFTGTVTLPAGSTAAAPLRLATGTNSSAAVFGAVEFDGTNLYLTNNSASPTRKTIAYTDSAIASGAVGSSQLAAGLTLGGTTTGTFSGPLSGNATTATSATSFTGSLLGDVSGTQGATSIAAATVTGKALTGFVSGAGTISETDTVLSAINKLNGNDALKANLASPTFTGTVTLPTGSTTAAPLRLATGTNLGAAVFGAVEFDGTNLYLTNNSASPTRKTIAYTDSAIASGAVGSSQLAAGLTLGGTTTGTFSGPLSGNATTATSATSFTGSLVGDVSGTQGATSIADATVTGKRLTGFASGTGLVSADDSLLSALGKLQGSKAPLASPTFTGTVVLPAGSTTAAPLRLATGTNSSVAVFGAVEFDGTNLYLTNNSASPTRKTLAYADSAAGGLAAERLIAAPLSPVLGWGSRSEGQATVPVLANVTAVSAGEEHSLALLKNGSVLAWGSNADGQTVVPAAALSGVTRIAAGFAHNVACKSDGTLVAWGASSDSRTAIPAGITTATNVAAGGLHSLALLADGTVRAWGDSFYGQATVPGNLTTVTAIAAGEFHSLALKSNGEVVAWGSDSIGQTAVPTAALSGVTAIAAGWSHSLALKSDGSVLAWGLNTAGQTDVPAGAASGVVQIAAGDTYSLALRSDGTVIAWGYKDEVDPVTEVPPAATQVTQIAAGGYHALALRADTVPVQFARLDHLGRLGIGRTPITYELEVNGNAWKSTAGAWLSNSDRRIKTEIESIEGALEKLDQVRLVDFRYTDDYLAAHPEIEDRRYPNVIAQEFATVFPDDVKGSGQMLPDGSEVLQVDTYPLTIYSAAAIQELHRENRLLQKKLNEQEVRLRKLEELLKNP